MAPATAVEADTDLGVLPISIETSYSWWVASVTLVMASLSFGAVTSIPVLLKPISQSWNTGAGDIAFAHTLTLCGAGLGSLFLGRMQDRFGFFKVALLAAAATAGGLWIASCARGPIDLYIAYGVLIGGIGQGALFSPLTAAVSLWFDRHRPLAIALAACGQSVGGLLLSPWLRWSAEHIGWRDTLRVYAVCAGAFIAACAFAFRSRPPVQQPNSGLRGEPGAAGRAGFCTLAMSLGCFNFATFIFVGHLTAFGEEKGYSPTLAALLMSVLLGISLLSRLTVGEAGRRWGHFRMLIISSLLVCTGTALLCFPIVYASSWIAIVLLGLGFGGYVPIYPVLARELFPSAQAGRRIAEIFLLGFLSAGIASWVGGVLRDMTGNYESAFACALVAALAGCLMLLRAGKQHPPS